MKMYKQNNLLRVMFALGMLFCSATLIAQEGIAPQESELNNVVTIQTDAAESVDISEVVEVVEVVPDQPVAMSVEELKKKVIQLNRDLFILEEDLLFPANTQFVVYLSLDTGKFLKLDSVSLKVDQEIVAAHLYTERQLNALQRGGMQRLYIGNLKTGEHEVVVTVNGIGPDNRGYKKASSLLIKKGSDIKSLEVRLQDQSENYQPSVSIVEWD